MEKPTGYIPKSEMKGGKCYIGICRNNYVAEWDSKRQLFVYIRYKFGHMLDTIEHFDDVKDSGTDGFVPLQELEHPKLNSWCHEFETEIGY
jgi:hypothetical protein